MPARKTAPTDFKFNHAGKQYTLPTLKSVPMGLIRRTRNMDQADQMFTILEEIAPAATLAALDEMTGDDFMDLAQRWAEHSGVSLGELDSSST